MLAIWSLVPLPFLHPAWTSGSSWFTYCLEDFEHYLECNCMVVWTFSLALPFFGTGMKTDLFQSWGHCWVFQNGWHTECSTLTTLSFRIWNTSLALLVVMFPRPTWFLTPGCLARWVTAPSEGQQPDVKLVTYVMKLPPVQHYKCTLNKANRKSFVLPNQNCEQRN